MINVIEGNHTGDYYRRLNKYVPVKELQGLKEEIIKMEEDYKYKYTKLIGIDKGMGPNRYSSFYFTLHDKYEDNTLSIMNMKDLIIKKYISSVLMLTKSNQAYGIKEGERDKVDFEGVFRNLDVEILNEFRVLVKAMDERDKVLIAFSKRKNNKNKYAISVFEYITEDKVQAYQKHFPDWNIFNKKELEELQEQFKREYMKYEIPDPHEEAKYIVNRNYVKPTKEGFELMTKEMKKNLEKFLKEENNLPERFALNWYYDKFMEVEYRARPIQDIPMDRVETNVKELLFLLEQDKIDGEVEDQDGEVEDQDGEVEGTSNVDLTWD